MSLELLSASDQSLAFLIPVLPPPSQAHMHIAMHILLQPHSLLNREYLMYPFNLFCLHKDKEIKYEFHYWLGYCSRTPHFLPKSVRLLISTKYQLQWICGSRIVKNFSSVMQSDHSRTRLGSFQISTWLGYIWDLAQPGQFSADSCCFCSIHNPISSFYQVTLKQTTEKKSLHKRQTFQMKNQLI